MSQRKVSTKEPDCEQLTLFQEDSPVSHFPWLESKKVKKMTVTSGRKCSELSENLRRVGSSVRTYLESCPLPGEQFVRTWSVRDTLSPFLINFEAAAVGAHTDVNGCSLSESVPHTMDSLPSRSYEAMKRQATNGGRKNRRRPGNLREQVDPLMCQAYEEARAEANGMMWPSPVASGKLNGGTRDFNKLQALKEQGQITEEERRSMSAGNGGQLNPDWVCWLMGFPTGWANISE